MEETRPVTGSVISAVRASPLAKVISPSAYLHRLSGRDSLQSLLIWAGYDTTFRPEFTHQALAGFAAQRIRHRTFYLPCGHYTTAKPPFVWLDGFAMSRFLLTAL